MTKYHDILGLIVKTFLVLLIGALVLALIKFLLKDPVQLEVIVAGGGGIGGLVVLTDRFYKYVTLSRATNISQNLDAETVRQILESLNGKTTGNGQ